MALDQASDPKHFPNIGHGTKDTGERSRVLLKLWMTCLKENLDPIEWRDEGLG